MISSDEYMLKISKQHIREFIEQERKMAYQQNFTMQDIYSRPLRNFDTIIQHSNPIAMNDDTDRELNITMVLHPTIIVEDRPKYAVHFIVELDWWHIEDLPEIGEHIKRGLPFNQMSYPTNYCISVVGIRRGSFSPLDDHIKRKYNMQTYSSRAIYKNGSRWWQIWFRNLYHWFSGMIQKQWMTKKGKIYGQVLKTRNRLQRFVYDILDIAKNQLRILKEKIRNKKENNYSNTNSNTNVNEKIIEKIEKEKENTIINPILALQPAIH